MARTTNPRPSGLSQIEVRLPELHSGQEAVLLDESRFKVVVCGRQWGKTMLGAVMCIREALRGGDVWWVAPTFPIGNEGWDVLTKLALQVPGTKVLGRPESKITFASGGTIELRSGDNPDSLRGATLNGAVIDEAAIAKAEVWPYLRPTLSVREGWALFISTPKGLNWFHDLYQDALRLDGWAAWRFPSVDSPFMPIHEVEAAREDLSPLMFSQEYLAEFISTGEVAFRQEWIQHYRVEFDKDDRLLLLGQQAVSLAGCTKLHTVDLAWSQDERADYTVISSWAVTPKAHLVLLDVIRGHFEGPDIVPKLRYAYEKWGGVLHVERAQQVSIIQEAIRTGLPVKELKADKDKLARSLTAQARMEQMRVWFPSPADQPWMRDLLEELLAFPAGRHDDFVDTLSYAVNVSALRSRYEEHGFRSLEG